MKSFVCSILFPIFLLALCLTSCKPDSSRERPVITVSIEPLRYVTEAVAGDRYTVEVLTPAGASPETYQPTPRQLTALSDSRLYIQVGTLGFEQTQLERMSSAVPHVPVVNASGGIPPIREGLSGTHSGDADPHTWTSPENLKLIASNIRDALARTDTAHIKEYTANYLKFAARMDSLDLEIRSLLQSVSCRTFLVYHPALAYYARAYGLHQLAVEQDGKDVSASGMARLIKQCREEGVKVVFIQKEHNGGSARAIARETGLATVEINVLSYNVSDELRRISQALSHE